MMTQLRLLFLEDSPLDAELTCATLADGGYDARVTRVDSREGFTAALCDRAAEFDLILADHHLPAFDGVAALHLARERRPEVPFIFLSGTLGEEVAIEAMKNGATDYVVKHRIARLVPAVRRALRETTERRELARTSGELRASEERYRLIVESASDFAIIMTDAEGIVRSWNPGAARIFGAEESAAVGRPLDAFFTPEDVAAGVPRAELDAAARDGRAADDRWLRRADGSRFFASGVANALRDGSAGGEPGGSLVGFLKIVRDVTDAKRHEESLRRRNDRLKLLSETATYLLSTRDDRRIVADLFDKLCDHLGLEVYLAYLADAGGTTLRLLASRNVPVEANVAIDQTAIGGQRICGIVAARGHAIVRENVQHIDDPHTAHIRSLGITAYACHPLIADGRLIGTLSLGTRTRAKFTPDELELMQTVADQIAAAIDRAHLLAREKKARADAEAAMEVAVSANRAKDDFLATVSHELRTPLTAILGWARMLHQDGEGNLDAETIREAVETIERNAKVQAQLIDDILDISRIISGKLRLNVEPTPLDRVAQDAADTLRPAADARGIALAVWVDPQAVVSGDADRLQQVIWNLLSNAIKFTPRGGRVALAVEREDAGRCRIAVTDTGKGITPAFLPHVFDPFRQADASSTRRHGGLGLGLAIVRHLVELHGGTIDAHSGGEGKGSTFTVHLPLVPAHAAARRGAAAGAAASQQRREDGTAAAAPTLSPAAGANTFECPPTLAGLRVLVVDDEPDTRRLLATLLQKCRAHVTAAASAAEALSALDSFRPDVLLSDLGMPGEDGYSLIRQLRRREDGDALALPAIALTAYARTEDRNRALAEGFHFYVTKPVEPNTLIAAVARAAGRATADETANG
jgi:PAS domain S-box-containing protein